MADAPCSAAFRIKYASFSGVDYYDVVGFGFEESTSEVEAAGGTRIAPAWAIDNYSLRAWFETDVYKSVPAKNYSGATLTVYFLEIGQTTGTVSCTGMQFLATSIEGNEGGKGRQRFNFRFNPQNVENTNPISVTV